VNPQTPKTIYLVIWQFRGFQSRWNPFVRRDVSAKMSSVTIFSREGLILARSTSIHSFIKFMEYYISQYIL